MMIGGFAFAEGDIVFVLENWLRLRFMVMVFLSQLILLQRKKFNFVKLINLCSNPDLVNFHANEKCNSGYWLNTNTTRCATDHCLMLYLTITVFFYVFIIIINMCNEKITLQIIGPWRSSWINWIFYKHVTHLLNLHLCKSTIHRLYLLLCSWELEPRFLIIMCLRWMICYH